MNALSIKVTAAAVMFAMLSIVAGCASGPSIERETATTRFDYPDRARAADTGVRFAMIESRLDSASDSSDAGADASTPFGGMRQHFQAQVQVQVEDADPETNPFQRRYLDTYQAHMERSLNRDIAELLSAKGFELAGTFERFKDLDDAKRREVLLTTVPTATLALSRDIDSRQCADGLCEERGTLRLDGQFLFLLIEPESESPVAVRRMNLHSLGVAEPYVRYTVRGESGDRPDRDLVDTSDRALVEALNRFYAAVMTEVDRMVSRRQVLAFQDTMNTGGKTGSRD